MKTCSSCKIEKPFEDFHKKTKERYQSSCKACRKIYVAKHYQDNKESYSKRSKAWKVNNPNRVLSNRYKLPEDKIAEIMSVNLCEICGNTENLVFDHIHKTGKARGCLCFSCNTMLGRLGDSNEEIRERIENVLSYINKNI